MFSGRGDVCRQQELGIQGVNTYGKALVASVAFVACLLVVYYLRVRYGKVDVVLYNAIVSAVIATAIVGVFLGSRFFGEMTGLEKSQLLVIWLLIGYAFAISVPTVIDRSLSFYILEKLQQRGGGIREDKVPDVFVNEYMVEYRLVDVRLTEQLQSGTIAIDHGCVRLTPLGERLASFSRFFRLHFLPKERLLMGAYSDDLVDPFRRSTTQVDYTCR